MLIDISKYIDYDHMTAELWDLTAYFKYDEEWGDPYKMWVKLIYALDSFRNSIHPNKLIINCGWELRDSGWHPSGAAVDLHCPTILCKDLAYLAMQFPFTGIGLYPFWNSPGLHLDARPLRLDARRRLWWRDKEKIINGKKVKKYHDIKSLSEFNAVPLISG